MFKIYDGREYFYQWDLDRKLIVYDQTIEEVHFCNKTDDNSLVCDVYTEGDLHLVNVPNILLQDNWRINVYAFDKNYTKYSKQFDVKSRTKPANYIYTETEVKRWEILEERVSTLENSSAAGGGMFYVDMEYYTATAPQSTNRTFEEIKEAYNGGLNVICRLNNYHILPLNMVTEEQITFCATAGADIVIATQGSDNSVFSEIIPMARAEDLEKKSNNVFYVEVTPVDEFNATCNRDFFDIQEAYNNGQEVKCIFEKFVLPVCFIIQNSQIIFGGACAYQSLYVSVANLNPIEVTYALATLAAAKEVASKTEFNQLVTMYTEDITELTNRVDTIESLAPETAQVGQVAVVKEIDTRSRVTKWGTIDLPSGGGTSNEWKLLIDAETTEEAHAIKYDFESPVSEVVGWVDLPILNDSQGIVYAFIGLSDNSHVRLTTLNTNVATRQRIYMQLHPAGGCVSSKSGSYAVANTLSIMPDEYAVAIHNKFKNGSRFTYIRLSRSGDAYVFPVGAKFMLWGR